MFHYLQIKILYLYLILVYHWNEMETVLPEDKCDATIVKSLKQYVCLF